MSFKTQSCVTVTTASGNTWTSTINCNLEEARQYYLGNYFVGKNEQLEKIISVEETALIICDKNGQPLQQW